MLYTVHGVQCTMYYVRWTIYCILYPFCYILETISIYYRVVRDKTGLGNLSMLSTFQTTTEGWPDRLVMA